MPIYDTGIAITTSGFEADIVMMYDLRSHIWILSTDWSVESLALEDKTNPFNCTVHGALY